MGYCYLVGFGGKTSTSRFEQWAKEHLMASTSSIPSRGSSTYEQWAKANFITANTSIPSPSSSAYDVLVAWAKANFLMTTS